MERHPLIALLPLTGIVLAGIARRCSNAAESAGVRDGQDGSVPISHSLHVFNVLAQPSDRLSKPGIGTLRNVMLSDIIATDGSAMGCSITGLPDHPIENISLSNISLGFEGGGTKEDDNNFEGVSTICERGPEVAGSALILWSNHTAQ